jgi:hypothetical protein
VLDVRVRHGGQALEGGRAGGDGGQAPRDVAAVGLDVQVGERLDHRPLGGAQVAQGDEVVGQRSRPVGGPGVEGGHEMGRRNQAVLEGQQAQQEVAVGGHGASSRGLVTVRRLPPWQSPGRRPRHGPDCMRMAPGCQRRR